MPVLTVKPLTRDAFAPYGDVIETHEDAEQFLINEGTTRRFHDLSTAQAHGDNARVGFSIFRTQAIDLPYRFNLVERHPLGSQAFIPTRPTQFFVIVAADLEGKPDTPEVFLAQAGQGINLFAGTWHGTLTVLDEQTDFSVIDRIGDGNNLETFTYQEDWEINHE